MLSIVVGELEYGFSYGNRYAANRRQLDIFLSQPFVSFLTVTRDTTRLYGQIMSDLRGAGTKIPTNDAWIAALALENDAGLWTYDKHFDPHRRHRRSSLVSGAAGAQEPWYAPYFSHCTRRLSDSSDRREQGGIMSANTSIFEANSGSI
jgi:predicted nucleic acid-binding protein